MRKFRVILVDAMPPPADPVEQHQCSIGPYYMYNKTYLYKNKTITRNFSLNVPTNKSKM